MRKIKLLLFTISIVLISNIVYAHPPSDMVLSYDQEKQLLSVKMRHTTHDPREDYIRKVEISVNGAEIVVKHYTIQLNTLEFSEDVALPAKEGDSITVKAYSKEGGSGVMTIQVPKKANKEEEKPETKQTPTTDENGMTEKMKKSDRGGY